MALGVKDHTSFTCGWSGLSITKRFGINSRTLKGNTPTLQGAFLDLPCAAAYLTDQCTKKNITVAKFKQLMNRLKSTYAPWLKGTPYENNIPLAADPELLKKMGWEEWQRTYMPKDWLAPDWGKPQTIEEYNELVAKKMGLKKRRAESDDAGASKKARHEEKYQLFLIKEGGEMTHLNNEKHRSLTALVMAVQEELKGPSKMLTLPGNQLLFSSELRRSGALNRVATEIVRKYPETRVNQIYGPALFASLLPPDAS